MKFLWIGLAVLVFVSIAVVEGRKGQHKRGRKEPHIREQNAGKVQVNNDVAPNQDEAKPKKAPSENDAEAHPAKKAKRGHRRHGAHNKNDAEYHLLDEEMHNSHHNKRGRHPFRDSVREMKKKGGKVTMEMLERLRDIPDMHLNKKQKERLIKKFQKKLQHVQENDSHGDEHEP